MTKALLTARVPDKTNTYGQPNPPLMPTLTGWVNGENTSALTTVPIASTAATPFSDVGEYEVIPSGGAAANYTFDYVTSKLTILAATLDVGTVTWTELSSLVYDNTAKTHTAAAPGVASWVYSYAGTNSTSYGPKADAPSEGGDYVATATAVGNYAGTVNRAFTIA
ncbi:MAG: MBG domain-containing protein, partial [Caldilinea sp.]